ncbi:MAG: hypothetical protein V3S27_03825 [Kiloniellales bacterium]
MTEEELAALAAWLRRTQGIDLEPALLREPAVAAAKLSALIGEAAEALKFGAEPSGFDLATAALKERHGGDAG